MLGIEWHAIIYTELGEIKISGSRQAVNCHTAFMRKAKAQGVLLTMEEVEAVAQQASIDNGLQEGDHD